MAKQYLGTKLQDLGNFEVLDPTDRILVIKPNDEGIMALSEFLLYVKANLDFSNYLTAKQVNDTFATKVDTYTKAAADAKFAFVDKTYTRTQTDAKFAVRADTFTKDEALGLFASTNNIYLKEEVYNKEEALHAFALKSEIPVLPDLSPYSTTAKGDLRWALKTDVYAKTESDVRYPLAVNTYSKSDSDVRFAKAANTYTKDEVEAKFLDNNEAYTKSYIDQSIYLKSQVYTKLETDAKFQLKSETYTISDVNSQFAAKSWVYSRGEAELTFAPKADTYTKTEVNTLTDTKVASLAKNLNDNYYNKSVSDARYTPVGTSYSKAETDTKYPVKGQTATSISLNPTSLIYTMVDGTSNTVTVPTWNQSTTGNAATATKLQTAKTINGVAFDGSDNILVRGDIGINTGDYNRGIRPNNITGRTANFLFASRGSMEGAVEDTRYMDLITLSTYPTSIPGKINALGFGKNINEIWHYQGAVGSDTWTSIKTIAYTDSSITGNAASATKLQTPRSIGITGAVTGTGVNFDGTSNIAINATAVDASKLTGIVPNASLSGVYKNVTLDISNSTVYSLKQPGDNNSVTAYGLGSIRSVGTTQNSVIVIKTNIPKGSVNVLSLHIKGLSDGETTNIDITISGWIQGNISKLSLGTKDYDVRKAQSSDGYACFIISHPSGYLGASTAFSIATAHLNFGVDVSTLNNWSIFETTDLSTFTNISQPAAQSTSIANTYWANIQNKPTTIAGYAITDAYTKADIYTKAEADGKYALLTNVYNKTEVDSKISTIDQFINTVTLSATNLVFTRKNGATINLAIPTWNQSTTGNAATATKLQTARNIAMTGDGNWAVNFDGTANVTANFTLANSGVTAGTYPKVTVDAKGRVTGGTGLTAVDIPSIDMSKVTTGILPVAQGGTGASNAAAARSNLGLGTAAPYNVGINAGQIRTNDAMVNISGPWNSAADGDKFNTYIPANGNIFTPVAFGNVTPLEYGAGMARRYIHDNTEYVVGWSVGLFNGYMYRFYAKRDTSTNKWTQYSATLLDTFNSSSTNIQFNTIKVVSPATTTALPNTFIEPSTGEIKKSTTSFGPLATASVVPVANGGTGATDAATARNNLGLGNAATINYLPSATSLSSGYLVRSGDFGLGVPIVTNINGDPEIKYAGFAGNYNDAGIFSYINAAYSNDWVWQLGSGIGVGNLPKFRYFYNGTTWSPWYEFAVQGRHNTFTSLAMSNPYTHNAAPNLYIDTDGVIKKTSFTFGSAATKNIGTNNGDVMTVGSFGIGGGNSILVDNTSVATILSSTDGKTGVYRADTGANTSFHWMPFLYMRTGDTHTVFGAQHQNEGVRVITWSDTTINTPVIRNLYHDKSTTIYNTTIDQPANVYITPEGTLKRATRVIYDASSLSGTINNSNLSGTYNGFNLELTGNRTVYTNNSNGKTVYGLADFMLQGGLTGCIVFKTTIPKDSNTMFQLYISGMIYGEGIFDTIIKTYQYDGNLGTNAVRVSRGSIDIPVRFGATPDGFICIIIGTVDKGWYFPQISITHGLLSNNAKIDYLKGWTAYAVTDLTGYTAVTVPFENNVSVAKVSWANVANRATTRDGYGITDVYTKAEADGRFASKIEAISNIGWDPYKISWSTPSGNTGVVSVPQWNQNTSGNAATATKLQMPRVINGVSFDGSTNITTPAYNYLYTIDNRAIKPINTTNRAITAAFSSLTGMNTGTVGSDYVDVLGFNSWDNESGGFVNALVFTKTGTPTLYHYTGNVGANSLNGYKQIAYTDSNITGNSATATKLQTPRTIGITGAAAAAPVSFDGTSNVSLNVTAMDATKLLGKVPTGSLSGDYTFNFTMNNDNGRIIKYGNGTETYFGLLNYSKPGEDIKGYFVIKTAIPKDRSAMNILQLQIFENYNGAFDNITLQWYRYGSWVGQVRTSTGVKEVPIALGVTPDNMVAIIIGNTNFSFAYPSFNIPWCTAHYSFDGTNYKGWSVEYRSDLTGYTDVVDLVNRETTTAVNWSRIGSKPTTLAGYGITDAWTSTSSDNRYVMLNESRAIALNNTVTVRKLSLNRSSGAGGINWYSESYTAWQDYMAPPGAGNGFAANITAPSGQLVTSWAKRSFIETSAGYGWTFESGTAHSTTPVVVAEIRASDGAARFGPLYTPLLNTSAFNSSAEFSFVNGNAAQRIYTGGLLASDSYADASKIPGSGIYSKGIIRAASGYYAGDARWMGVNSITPKTVGFFFTSAGGLTNGTSQAGEYGDFIALNTYDDSSGGRANGLLFSKNSFSLYHYQADFGATNWGTPQQIAYVTSNVASANKLSSARLIGDRSFDGTGNISLGGTIQTDTVYNGSFIGFYTAADKNTSQQIRVGSILVSSTWADAGYVPTNGIFSRGDIYTGGNLRAEGNLNINGNVNATGYLHGAAIGITGTTGKGSGISLYGGSRINGLPDYGLAFATTGNFGTHGDTAADWATYFTMSSDAQRGWIFRMDNNTNVASISGRGHAYFNYVYSYGDVTAFSDRRLKENIEPITSALSKVKELNGVTYTRNDLDDKERTHIGLIAQDVQAVFPEAVHESNDGYLSLNYMGLVGGLVEAIKELDTKNQTLEARLAKLEEKLS